MKPWRTFLVLLLLGMPVLIGCQRSVPASGDPVAPDKPRASNAADLGIPDEVEFSGRKSLLGVLVDRLEEGEDGLTRLKGKEEPFTGRSVDASSGYRQQEQTWWQGRLHGAQTHWNSRGNRFKQVVWRNARRHGFSTFWYDDGARRQSIHYQNGIKDGTSTRWYPTQVKMQEETYRDGILDGTTTDWDELGREKTKVEFQKGREVHRRRWVWANVRQVDRVITMIDGEEYSETIYNYSFRGYKLSATTMRNGRKDGAETRWHSDGTMMMESHWKEGKLDGVMLTWHRNGKPRIESRWEMGRLVFKKSWGPDGQQLPAAGFQEDGSPR